MVDYQSKYFNNIDEIYAEITRVTALCVQDIKKRISEGEIDGGQASIENDETKKLNISFADNNSGQGYGPTHYNVDTGLVLRVVNSRSGSVSEIPLKFQVTISINFPKPTVKRPDTSINMILDPLHSSAYEGRSLFHMYENRGNRARKITAESLITFINEHLSDERAKHREIEEAALEKAENAILEAAGFEPD